MSTSIADVLDGAADLLTERGWKQGGGIEDGCPVCVGLALLSFGLGDPGDEWAAVEAVCDALGIEDDNPRGRTWGLYEWNDAPGRTAEEVISTLRRVAAEERAKP